MRHSLKIIFTTMWAFFCLEMPLLALAASEQPPVSTTGSVLKMLLGLVLVLGVMALVSWGVKRMLPNAVGQQSAVRIVGGVSVGSRERVVVLEVANRWIVVGVAPGQVNGIANLDIGSGNIQETISQAAELGTVVEPQVHPLVQPLVKPFAEWLKKAGGKTNA